MGYCRHMQLDMREEIYFAVAVRGQAQLKELLRVPSVLAGSLRRSEVLAILADLQATGRLECEGPLYRPTDPSAHERARQVIGAIGARELGVSVDEALELLDWFPS